MVEIDKNKNEVVIRLPLNSNPEPSKSGKTLIVAGTEGFTKTTAKFKDKPVSISVNVTIPNK